MPVIFTPSFKKTPSAALPPCFSFLFPMFTLFLLILYSVYTQFTLPPITPPFLCSPPLIYCWLCCGREEKKTPLRFSSPPFVVFISPYLLFSSSLTCLLGCVFLIFLLFSPPLALVACLLFECWLETLDSDEGHICLEEERTGEEEEEGVSHAFLIITWAFLAFKKRLKQSISSHFDRLHQRKRLRLCLHGIWRIWLLRDLIFHRTGSHIQTSFGQYRRDFMPQIHPNPEDSHSHRPSRRYMSASRGG